MKKIPCIPSLFPRKMHTKAGALKTNQVWGWALKNICENLLESWCALNYYNYGRPYYDNYDTPCLSCLVTAHYLQTYNFQNFVLKI